MKKRMVAVLLLTFCFIFIMAPFSYSASAASIGRADNADNVIMEDVVYTLVLMGSANKDDTTPKTSYSLVSQYYYTDTSAFGDDKKQPIAERTTTYTPISKENICSGRYGDRLRDISCKQKKKVWDAMTGKEVYEYEFKSYLARLQMSKDGDIIIDTPNDVRITGLSIRYILADKGSNFLFCDKKEGIGICENAKSINSSGGVTSNWQSKSSEGGTLNYRTQQSFEDVFAYSEIKPGLLKVGNMYSNFNVFDKIMKSYDEYVNDTGIYVAMSMTVETGEKEEKKTYYVNDYTFSKDLIEYDKDGNPTNTPVYFEEVGNISNSRISAGYASIVDENPEEKSKVNSSAFTVVSSVAALVRPDDPTDKDSEGYKGLKEFLDEDLRNILLVVLGILFLVVGTYTGITIVKSSDEPEVRKDAIKKLIAMFIGAFSIAMILLFYEELIEVFRDLFK